MDSSISQISSIKNKTIHYLIYLNLLMYTTQPTFNSHQGQLVDLKLQLLLITIFWIMGLSLVKDVGIQKMIIYVYLCHCIIVLEWLWAILLHLQEEHL